MSNYPRRRATDPSRIERWFIIGDGLVYKVAWVQNTRPLTNEEVLRMIKTDHVVITIFDALTDEFLGMAYASSGHRYLEEVRYDSRL